MTQLSNLNHQQESALYLLQNHHPVDDKERSDLERMQRFIAHQPDCYGKANTRAHVTGSAFLLDPSNRLLLTFHGKLDRWLQLGGHSDDDDLSPAETALREAREESGLPDVVFHPAFGDLPIDVDIHTIPGRQTEPAHEHLDFRFVCLTRRPEKIVTSAESKHLDWWTIDSGLDLGFDPALKRALGKIRRQLMNLSSDGHRSEPS